MADKQTTAVPVVGAAGEARAPPEVVMPPAPPGESSPAAVQKTHAVADALVQLGDQADLQRVAGAVKAQTGMDLDPGEVATIVRALRERAASPPPLDQPPPEDARKRPAIEHRG